MSRSNGTKFDSKRIGLIVLALVFALSLFVIPAFADNGPAADNLLLGVTDGSTIQVGEEMPLENRFELSAVSDVSASDEIALDEISVEKIDMKSTAPAASAKVAEKKGETPNEPKAPAKPKARQSSGSSSSWKSVKASWYGPGLYGNHTASGMTLNPGSMVLAHRSLPFGTKVEIRYDGKTVIAEVQDRGPFISGRVFDLGPGVAKAVGFEGVHTIEYRIVK